MTARARRLGEVALACALVGAGAAGTPGAAGEAAGDAGAADDASRRLAEAIARVERGAPERELRAAEIEAGRRDARARGGAFAPYLELQREGLEADLDDAPNATGYLRLGTPVATPGQLRAGRELARAGTRWSEATERAAARERARSVAALWLDLARAEERLVVLRARLERIERATALQRERRRLGEVAGADVEQLDLERARLDALLAGEEAVRARLRAALRRWTDDSRLEPRPGDLDALRRASPAPLPAADRLAALVDASPAQRAARSASTLAETSAVVERRTARGRPAVEIEYERIPDLGPAEGFDAYGVRVHVPLPFGSAARETRAAADARRRGAQLSAEASRRETLARARGELEAARGAEAALARLDGTVADLDARAGALGERFRLGAVDYLVYLDALDRLDEVRIQHVETLHAALAARLELAALGAGAGTFPLPAESGGTAPEEIP